MRWFGFIFPVHVMTRRCTGGVIETSTTTTVAKALKIKKKFERSSNRERRLQVFVARKCYLNATSSSPACWKILIKKTGNAHPWSAPSQFFYTSLDSTGEVKNRHPIAPLLAQSTIKRKTNKSHIQDSSKTQAKIYT